MELARVHSRPKKKLSADERIKGIRILAYGELDTLFREGTIISQDVL
jgi:hypothetical protein